MIQRWEYQTILCEYGDIEDYANTLGDEGWELVTALNVGVAGRTKLIFKRPLPCQGRPVALGTMDIPE